MIRKRYNDVHDKFCQEVTLWCLKQGWWVHWSAQEIAGTARFTPDLGLYDPQLHLRIYIEAKVSTHGNCAIALDEYLFQRSLQYPVVIALSGGPGFLLKETQPDYILIPANADPQHADFARKLARELRCPFKEVPGRSATDASGIPFLLFRGDRFEPWQRVLSRLLGGGRDVPR